MNLCDSSVSISLFYGFIRWIKTAHGPTCMLEASWSGSLWLPANAYTMYMILKATYVHTVRLLGHTWNHMYRPHQTKTACLRSTWIYIHFHGYFCLLFIYATNPLEGYLWLIQVGQLSVTDKIMITLILLVSGYQYDERMSDDMTEKMFNVMFLSQNDIIKPTKSNFKPLQNLLL